MSGAEAPSASGRKAEPEAEVIVHKTWVYNVGRFLVSVYMRGCHRLLVERAERIPREGGALILSNHQSFLDIPVIAASTRRHVCFVARESLARSRSLAFVMRGSGAVLIRRGKADRKALREMTQHLERGDLVTVYPEGTRSPDGSLGEFRPGALLAARMAKVPILPVGIRGTVDALGRNAKWPSLGARVGVRYGEMIDSARPDALEGTRAAIAEMIGDGRFSSVPPL